MARQLKDNISSSYFDAAHKLYPRKARRRIVAYVESYEDVGFWKELLAGFETDNCYFQVMLPSAVTLSKGKKMVLMNTLNTAELGKSLIACVDSDYDFLMQDKTASSRKINDSRYIFQTYAYAIENYHCYAESLHNVVVQSTLNDRHLVDFNKFFRRYSEIAYPLFLWSIWFYRNHDTYTFPMFDFNSTVRLHQVRLKNPYLSLDEMAKRVEAKLAGMERKFPDLKPKVTALGEELRKLGLNPETTYLYIQGHHIMDNVAMKLLTPICIVLRRQREDEIRRLAEHNEQYRNELTSYRNSQSNVTSALKKNTGYKNLYLYRWLHDDLEKFIKEL
ncbi:MAG: DUF4435 domain-containing protein [Mediterranea sp.]|jgi:hypothetical protein|nr:DUF4435 domain-containing protein [Mediterranea sp.]